MPLKKDLTLQKKVCFDKVFKGAELKLRSGAVLILGRKNKMTYPRLGVSVKKSDFSLAVDRNKIKRMVKSSFSNSLQDLPCFDFVVLVNKGGTEEVKRDCELIFKKVLSA